LQELATLFDEGKLKVVLDPSSSSKFTLEAVKCGFHVMAKRKAHGKVVIELSG
jgi:NADPH:quinone reductase-like Zn-dependent oxidoreductase